MSSGLSCAVGFKNGTDGSLAVAVNALILIQDTGIVNNNVVVQIYIAIAVMDAFTGCGVIGKDRNVAIVEGGVIHNPQSLVSRHQRKIKLANFI